jgi:NADPH-dependent glutamate synthase beta subunit-like oxidoreductase
VEIGRDVSMQQLLDSHDAVFVGTGPTATPMAA